MHHYVWRILSSVVVVWLIAPQTAPAAKQSCCDQPCTLACFEWRFEEVEETVYEITYREEKHKIRRPIIKEIRKPVTEKVCTPISRTILKKVEIPDYKAVDRCVDTVVCRQCVDECGNCVTTSEVVSKPVTCLVKTKATIDVPVVTWTRVATENTYERPYLMRDWEEREITVQVPVKTPKVIKRKCWVKVPVHPCCSPCCDPCSKQSCNSCCDSCSK